MTRALLPALAAGLLVGCSEVQQPERTDTYAFAVDCSIPGTCAEAAGNLQIIFRWPQQSLPVRVWVAPGSGLGQAAAGAILTWERVALYGEFFAGFVSDSARADIVFRRGDPVAFSGNGSSLDCRGTTTVGVERDTTISLPFIVTISPRSGRSSEDHEACFDVVAVHELGHALGLFLESGNPADVMYPFPRSAQPSARDRASFVRLYHTAPTVRLPDGR